MVVVIVESVCCLVVRVVDNSTFWDSGEV
jgi:hypothetical protein